MAAFSAASFTSKLEKLSQSTESIQTLSHWVQYHKKAVKESAAIWGKTMLRAPPDRRLLYLYLVNEILQSSRRKGPEFVKEYGAQMSVMMPETYAACPPAVREKIMRVVSIWEDRRVLGSQEIANLRAGMMQAANPGTSGAVVGSGSSGPSHEAEPALEEEEEEEDDEDAYVPQVVAAPSAAPKAPAAASAASPRAPAAGAAASVSLPQLLSSLEEDGLIEQLAKEREAAVQLDELENSEVTDADELNKQHMQALGAVELLQAHEKALQGELDERHRLILMLAASCERQQVQCTTLSTAVDDNAALLARAEAARELIESRQAQMSSIAEMAANAL